MKKNNQRETFRVFFQTHLQLYFEYKIVNELIAIPF